MPWCFRHNGYNGCLGGEVGEDADASTGIDVAVNSIFVASVQGADCVSPAGVGTVFPSEGLGAC